MNGLIQALHHLAGKTGDVRVHVHSNVNISSRTESVTAPLSRSDDGTESPRRFPGDTDDKARFRNMLVLMTVVAVIVFGLVAVLIPDRTVVAAADIAVVGTVGATLIKLTFRKD